MAVVGVALLALYAALAYAGFALLVAAWRLRPDPATTVLVLAATTLAVGYASYRFGTAQLLSVLDATPLPRRRASTASSTTSRRGWTSTARNYASRGSTRRTRCRWAAGATA